MRFGSVCSGIEAASVAWNPLGWKAVFFSEIDAFPCAALKARHPGTPNHGDMTQFKEWPDAAIDVLVGGTPCQSFSVAGLRKGLDDPRGNLMLTYLAIARRYRPQWLVWENVPGVLSDRGNAFGAFLGGLAELGYGFAYRILDAQYCGVPQRRRRVFVVGCLGDWRGAAAVLFERASLRGDSAPSRKARQRVAGTIGASSSSGRSYGSSPISDNLIAPEIARCIATREGTSQDWETTAMVAHSLRADGFDASEDGTGRGTPLVPWLPQGYRVQNAESVADTVTNNPAGGTRINPVLTLAIRGRGDSHDLEYREDGIANAILTPNGGRAGIGVGAVAFAQNQRDEVRQMDVAGALAGEPGMKQQTYIAQDYANGAFAEAGTSRGITTSADRTRAAPIVGGMAVRRLTPIECERLMGFPDNYSLITYRGKPAADGPRYKSLGNSMAVPVMAWIGQRIQQVDTVLCEHQTAQFRNEAANTQRAQEIDERLRVLQET